MILQFLQLESTQLQPFFNNKWGALPKRITEFVPASSQSSGPKKTLTYPTSPTPSSQPESVDLEHLETSGSGAPTELTLQKLFHFREDLQVDFRQMMTECKNGYTSASLLDGTEHKITDFAKSRNLLIDSHLALVEANTVMDLEDRSRRNYISLRGILESVTPDLLN